MCVFLAFVFFFFFSSRRRHTRLQGDWSSDVCSSDLRFLLTSPSFLPIICPPPLTVFLFFADYIDDGQSRRSRAPRELNDLGFLKCWRCPPLARRGHEPHVGALVAGLDSAANYFFADSCRISFWERTNRQKNS